MLLVPALAGTASAKSVAPQILTEESNTGVTFTRNFNPFDATSLSTEMNMRSLVYEPLFEFDFLKSGTIYPWLAKSYKWSHGGKTLTFHIRSGVNFSNGTPFSAADVAFTFNLMNTDTAANYAGDPPLASPAKATNRTTVVLNYKTSEYSDFEAIAGGTYMVPESVWKKIKSPATATISDPIGTGPYVLKSFTTQLVTFSANSHYWDGKSAVSEVRIPSYDSNSSASTALAAGLLTWAGNDIPSIKSVFLDKNPSTNHDYFAPGNTVTLMFNVANGGPLATAKVRQAIAYGINRTELAKEGESGYENPATSTSGLILPGQKQYLTAADTNDLPPKGTASKLASILTSDGYAKVGALWEKNGTPIKFTIEDPTSYSDYYADAQLISQQLSADGIEASVNGVTPTTWTSDMDSGHFTSAIRWGNGGATPYVQYQQWFTYTESAPLGKSATQDLGRFNTAGAMADLHKYATTDPSTVPAITNDVQALAKIMTTQVPDTPLVYGADWDEYTTAKFTGWPTASNPYIDPSPNDPELPYILMHLQAKK